MKSINKLLAIAIILALTVIVLGAYTRLKDAGLGCPDWPGCYGQIIAPSAQDAIAKAQAKFPTQPFEAEKAWTEMIHRYCAGTLGLLVFVCCGLIFRARIKTNKHISNKVLFATTLLALLIIFQALLGMWTVTMRLYPVVVMGHLLGGFSVVATLWWIKLNLKSSPNNSNITSTSKSKLGYYLKGNAKNYCNHYSYKQLLSPENVKIWASFSLLLVFLQLSLGGWVSSNYAAVVCPDFPSCQGTLWPNWDFANAFNLFNVGIFDSPGIALENNARVTIQMCHRIGALLVTIATIITAIKAIRLNNKVIASYTSIALALLTIQLVLGISNVLAGLPLWVAVLHNAVGALLFLSLIGLRFKVKHIAA